MERRTVLAAIAAGTTTAAGCVADGKEFLETGRNADWRGGRGDDTREDSVLDHFDGEPTRPECPVDSKRIEAEVNGETRELETAATIPYPDPPESYTPTAIVSYVEAFEEAYVTHDELCDQRGGHYVLGIRFDVETSETWDRHVGITTVFLLYRGGATSGIGPDGSIWMADLAHTGVAYAVDETGVARARFEDVDPYGQEEFEQDAPEALEEGELVAAFE